MFKIGFAVVMLSGSLACAQHATDIVLGVQGGVLVTGATRPEGGVEFEKRVFVSRLGEVAPNFSSDPGFDCLPGTFPAGTRNGFRIVDALRIWDGSGLETVAPARMNISFVTLNVDTPLVPGVVEGFTLAVGSNGQWHRHLDFVLEESAADGFYVLTLQLFSTAAAIVPSSNVYIIFNQNMPRSGEEAVVNYITSLIESPPCPADFNQDGGVDGGDVESFFTAWADAQTAADVNVDGGVDGSDVETFFLVWAAGGC
jgi:hypothetical protein